MDGVIIRSEDRWNAHEAVLFAKILTPEIRARIGTTTRGMSESQIFARLQELGHTGTKQELYDAYGEEAERIYREGELTPGMDDLLHVISETGARIGLVSSSPRPWIDMVLARLPHAAEIGFVESVNEHPALKPKPAPDGYLAAMEALGVKPQDTLIVEDSQTGINAAVASGAHVCCLTIHHESDPPAGVEVYAHTAEELTAVCLRFLRGGYLGR